MAFATACSGFTLTTVFGRHVPGAAPPPHLPAQCAGIAPALSFEYYKGVLFVSLWGSLRVDDLVGLLALIHGRVINNIAC